MLNITFVVDPKTFSVTFSGDVSLVVPINPETKVSFLSVEDATSWAAAAVLKMEASIISPTVKVWTPYQFMKNLDSGVLAAIIGLEDSGDITTKVALKMWSVAQDIRSNDPNLLATLNYWVSMGVMTEAQVSAIIG